MSQPPNDAHKSDERILSQIQSNPRIKKFLKRQRGVDKLRSLSKFCVNATIPKEHQAYFFSQYFQQIFDAVLLSSTELNTQAREQAQQQQPASSSLFDVFKKNKHIEWEDFKPPLLVLRHLIWFQKERFRTGWQDSALLLLLTLVMNPANRSELKILGLDCVLAVLDVVRPTATTAAAAAAAAAHHPYVVLLQNTFQHNSELWSDPIIASNQLIFALSQLPPASDASPTSDASLSDPTTSNTAPTTGAKQSSKQRSKQSSRSSVVHHGISTQLNAPQHTMECAQKMFVFASASNNHSKLCEADVQRLLFWFDIILNTVGSGAFGYASVSFASKSLDDSSPACMISSFAMDVNQVGTRALLVGWMVNHLFENEFATVALSTQAMSSVVFQLLGKCYF